MEILEHHSIITAPLGVSPPLVTSISPSNNSFLLSSCETNYFQTELVPSIPSHNNLTTEAKDGKKGTSTDQDSASTDDEFLFLIENDISSSDLLVPSAASLNNGVWSSSSTLLKPNNLTTPILDISDLESHLFYDYLNCVENWQTSGAGGTAPTSEQSIDPIDSLNIIISSSSQTNLSSEQTDQSDIENQSEQEMDHPLEPIASLFTSKVQ